jgi:peptidoglycan/LPS O-acetylase OafA/YrhL
MLGIFRYILALAVAASHVWSETMFTWGLYAVFCFYLISGYLMCLVLNEVYVTRTDTFKYVANRALRIYPPYWTVLALTFLVSRLFQDSLDISVFHKLQLSTMISMPESLADWVSNLTLFYNFKGTLLISQAWSLEVELVFYVAMIFLVRSKYVVVAWFLASLSYVLYQHYIGAVFYERYSTVLGGSIAFSTGALIYYFRRVTAIRAWHLPIAIVAYFAHFLFAGDIWGFDSSQFSLAFSAGNFGLYGNLVLGAYLLYAIVSYKERDGPFASFGRAMGDIAYAVFLSHWALVLLMTAMGFDFFDRPTFVITHFVLLNIVSVLLYRWIERPVNRHFRDKIRARV